MASTDQNTPLLINTRRQVTVQLSYSYLFVQINRVREGPSNPSPIESLFRSLLNTILVTLFLTIFLFLPFAMITIGSVLVYLIYRPNTTDSSSDDYCHPTLYYFAFWVSTAYYIFIALFCFCCCCVYCLGACAFDGVE
ncbi:uncharacterized protein LOC129260203 [Lytechinus pictus]|uniref:uncharacterized protein LOC129260203 n=1 Tax=Lytechinus pictus TaxID=7653 RepID=UPI0030B9BDA8